METNKLIRKVNKKGNTILFVMFSMLFIIVLMVSYGTYRLNMTNVNAKTIEASTENEFLNEFEKKVTNESLVNLYEPTLFQEEFEGKQYTAEIEPNGEITTKPVKEVFDLTWDNKLDVTNIKYDSKTNNQQLFFSGKDKIDLKPNDLFKSTTQGNIKLFVPFSGTLEEPTSFGSRGVAVRVMYRVGENKSKQSLGYPTNKTLDISGSSDKDIINIDYLDKNGNLLGWSRFIKNGSTSYNNLNQFMFVRMPNTNRIIGNKNIDYLIGNANLQIGEELNSGNGKFNTVIIANKSEEVCYHWDAYSDLSALAGLNKTNPKGSIDLVNSACGKNRSWGEQLDFQVPQLNPYTNGFHNLTVAEVTKIKNYRDVNYPNATFESNWKSRFYCSDPVVNTEAKRKVKKALDDYKIKFDAAVIRFQAAVKAAYDAEQPYPSWSSYKPADPIQPTKIPCIDSLDRDSKLVQYEQDHKLKTQLSINIVNNVNSFYKVEVEHLVDVERFPVRWITHYMEGSVPYKLEDANDNRTYKKADGIKKITLSKDVSNNYKYNNIDLIGTYSKANSSVESRTLNLSLENSTIRKVTITSEEFDYANFKFKIKDSEGKVVREKEIKITNGQ